MKKILLLMIIPLTQFVLISCGSPQHSKDQVLAQVEKVNRLKSELQTARENSVDMFAPSQFEKAEENYREAIKASKEAKKIEAGRAQAKRGLETLEAARSQAIKTKDILEDANQMRLRALDANAEEHFSDELEATDQRLKEAALLVADGEVQDAKRIRDNIIDIYSELEIKSLKKSITEGALKAFREAEDAGAEEYAPVSYKKAREKIMLTKDILDTDRNEVGRAREQAREAKYLSEKAEQITLLAKTFERRGYTREDMILWYHIQLEKLSEPLNVRLPFDRENEVVLNRLLEQLESLKASLNESVEAAKAREKTIRSLQQELTSLLSSQEKEEFLERQRRERFKKIRNLFKEDEATVYRASGDQVVIKAHGFGFPVGEANIETKNYPLARKIVEAIYTYPEPQKIIVSGHTDSTGSKSLNLDLSKKRANNVEALIESLGGLNESKVISRGYGESEPTETNTTEEGRALNRRIEIRIM
jgi:outer membrane protein OmpA-like peptidoglycan-associated protein